MSGEQDRAELVADLRRRAQSCRELESRCSGECLSAARLRGKAKAYDHAAELVEDNPTEEPASEMADDARIAITRAVEAALSDIAGEIATDHAKANGVHYTNGLSLAQKWVREALDAAKGDA